MSEARRPGSGASGMSPKKLQEPNDRGLAELLKQLESLPFGPAGSLPAVARRNCPECSGTGQLPGRRRTVTGADGRHGSFWEQPQCSVCRGTGSVSPEREAAYRREKEEQKRQSRADEFKSAVSTTLSLALFIAILSAVIFCWGRWPYITAGTLFLLAGVTGISRAVKGSGSAGNNILAFLSLVAFPAGLVCLYEGVRRVIAAAR